MNISKQQQQNVFSCLGHSLFMPEDSNTKARRLINDEIFLKLKNANLQHCSINRAMVMGSAEKRTGVWPDMDYDCTIFVNLNDPMPDTVDKVAQVEKRIITEWAKHLGSICKMHDWRLDVSFDGFDVDLLVAFDASSGFRYDSKMQQQQLQREGIMKIIKSKGSISERIELSRKFSPSLGEAMIEFIKKQSPATHELIRMAKLWVKFAGPPRESVQGFSTLLEIVCVHAAETTHEPNCVLSAFKQFLLLLTMHMIWGIKQKVVSMLSSEESRMIMQKPFVINPENPYENMYKGENVREFLNILASGASNTLYKLNTIDGIGPKKMKGIEKLWLYPFIHQIYVKGTMKKLKIRRTIGYSTFYADESTDKVFFPQLIQSPSVHKEDYENLMRFFLCCAAFIPRDVRTFDEYCNGLKSALGWFEIRLHAQPNHVGNFRMEFPVSWGKGICISGRL